jgi:hypothetical protein
MGKLVGELHLLTAFRLQGGCCLNDSLRETVGSEIHRFVRAEGGAVEHLVISKDYIAVLLRVPNGHPHPLRRLLSGTRKFLVQVIQHSLPLGRTVYPNPLSGVVYCSSFSKWAAGELAQYLGIRPSDPDLEFLKKSPETLEREYKESRPTADDDGGGPQTPSGPYRRSGLAKSAKTVQTI